MFRESWVKDRFYHLPVELRHINDTKGWGVFALEAIPKNTVVEVCPVILYHKDLHAAASDLADVPYSFAGNTHILESYAFNWAKTGMVAIAMGYGGMYNHSYKPNMRAVNQQEPIEAMVFVTIEDISPGDELTHCYAPWSEALPFIPEDEMEETAFDWPHGQHKSYEEALNLKYGIFKADQGMLSSGAAYKLKDEERDRKMNDGRPRMGDWVRERKDENK